MNSDFFSKFHTLHQTEQPFVIATAVRSEKPTSAKPGAKAISVSGSVSTDFGLVI